MKVNRNYKASVFSDLFSDPDILRELYCALEGVSLPENVPITINTLDDVVFMDRINDISFVIGGKIIVLLEHQSSLNPNITLRLLMYIARVYEKITEEEDIYSEKRITIPKPEFFVLYNGQDPFADEAILNLSDSFESISSLGLAYKEIPALELTVKVININDGKNEELVNRCKTLSHYCAFINKAREYVKQGLSLAAAVKKAIQYCKNHDILKEYLEEKGSEVYNMLMTEWNWDKAKEVWQREAFEDGQEEEREKWQTVVAEKDMVISDQATELAKQAVEIAELKRRLGEQ